MIIFSTQIDMLQNISIAGFPLDLRIAELWFTKIPLNFPTFVRRSCFVQHPFPMVFAPPVPSIVHARNAATARLYDDVSTPCGPGRWPRFSRESLASITIHFVR